MLCGSSCFFTGESIRDYILRAVISKEQFTLRTE